RYGWKARDIAEPEHKVADGEPGERHDMRGEARNDAHHQNREHEAGRNGSVLAQQAGDVSRTKESRKNIAVPRQGMPKVYRSKDQSREHDSNPESAQPGIAETAQHAQTGDAQVECRFNRQRP